MIPAHTTFKLFILIALLLFGTSLLFSCNKPQPAKADGQAYTFIGVVGLHP